MPLLLLFAGSFGSIIGSFLNVVVYRVPLGRSIVSPPSACTTCGSRIRAVDNVPVLSWLFLRGRCHSCGDRISARYPAVELATGVFFALVVLRFVPAVADAGSGASLAGSGLALVAFLYLAAISVVLALVDLDVRRLPNVIVLPAYAVGAVLLGAAAVLTGDGGALLRAGIGAGALFALYLALALVKPGGMGLGDVKLAGVLGLFLGWLGWEHLVVGAFAGFLFGGVFGIALLATRRARASTAVPFGPWMLLGAWVAVFAAPAVWSAYLRATGLL
jgi:leader peptidase (prepilin peptidase)/N-methyltransferase